MRNKKINLLIGFVLLLLAVQVFGYDNLKTHPQLTEAAAVIYNNQTDNKLTQKQINWLKDGTIAEDTDPRYINHYYNPINGEGVSGWDTYKGIPVFTNGLPAKLWAKAQGSVTGDYSVDAVFKNYREGNLKRAYQGVGHIAHLIQDMAVPAHTRNDSHADGDPYEIWAEQYGAINLSKVDFIQVDSIDKIFNELAGYSNKNFASKDTINNDLINNIDKIKIEKDIEGKNVQYGYKNNYKFLKVLKGVNYNFYELDFKVHLDYWNMLYPRAIGYSAGAIDYFIKGFAEIDKTKAQEKQLSFLQKVEKGARGLLDNISYIWGDTFLAIRNTATDDWNNLTGAANNTYDFSQLVYESGKEIAADAARQGADAIEDISAKVLSAAETAGASVKHPITAADLFKPKKAAADEKNKTGGKTPQSSCGKDCGGTKKTVADEKMTADEKAKISANSPKSSCGKDCVGKETSQSSCGRDCDATNNVGVKKDTPQSSCGRDCGGTNSNFLFSGGSSVAIDQEIKDIAVKASAIIPSIEIIAKPAAISSSTTAVFLFSVNNEKDFQCRLDSAEWQICQKQISFQDLSQGTHSLKLLAVSASGDIASSSYDWFIETAAPLNIVIADAIGDLIISHPFTGSNSITLRWTAPKNAVVQANARYDLRYQVKSGECDLVSVWDNAATVASSSLPAPASAGVAQEVKISGLDKETEYCFALKTFNGAVWSHISNQAEAKTLPDIAVCSAIPADGQGAVKTDKLLLKNSPYCFGDSRLIINAGQSLAIEPGVVIKLKEESGLIVKGELKAIGLPGQPIVFTSYYDNAKGGKVSEAEHIAAPGDWGFIAVSQGGKLFLENTIINYGGKTSFSPAMYLIPITEAGVVYIDGGEASIINAGIAENFAGVDILFNSTVNISFSDILNNQDDGVRAYGNNSTINIADSNIFNNGAAGIRMYDNTESIVNAENSRIYGNHSGGAINNSLVGTTTAINNWWGDNSGPYHEILNPSGQGNKIEGAVLFDPWVGKEY